MKELYELKDMLCEELKKYGKKGDLTAGSLDVVDKLTHTLKNLDKVIESCEGDYSGSRPYADGDYRSYARSRARRDSMGRYSSDGYSRHDDMIGELKYLMSKTDDDQTRKEFQRFISKMEAM